MRGALTEATLPVVMRRTCACPLHLLSSAVKCFIMRYLDKSKCCSQSESERVYDTVTVSSCVVVLHKGADNTRTFRTGKTLVILKIFIYFNFFLTSEFGD